LHKDSTFRLYQVQKDALTLFLEDFNNYFIVKVGSYNIDNGEGMGTSNSKVASIDNKTYSFISKATKPYWYYIH